MKKNSGSMSFRSSRDAAKKESSRKHSRIGSSAEGDRSLVRGGEDYRSDYREDSSWDTDMYSDRKPSDTELRYRRIRQHQSASRKKDGYTDIDRTSSANRYGSSKSYSGSSSYKTDQSGYARDRDYTSGQDTSYRRNGSGRTGGTGSRVSGAQGGRGRRDKKQKKGRRMGCLIPILVILILVAAAAFLLLNRTFSKIEKHKLDQSVITVNKEDKKMNKYQTIALFGVDSQDNVIGDRGSRSDSIIVASINKTSKKVKLMSIYRDTYVSIDGQYDKINAAYSYGGPEQAINTINRNLDLNITDFATVNFKALADAVDVLGGIPLTISSEKELKNLNDYIGNMNKINGGNSPKFDDVGTYTFDGNQAVAYSRIRYMEGGDHARAGHQRLVVEGILAKAKKQPWKINKLVDQVLPQCKTSFSTGEFTRMAVGLPLYDIVDSQAYPFDSFDEKYNGIYYGFPTTVKSNTIKAHEYLFGTEDYQPTDELLRISEKVEDVTSSMGY